MKIYFMRDNHTFADVGDGQSSREAIKARITELFNQDQCGCVFARCSKDRTIADMHGKRQKDGTYAAEPEDMNDFLNRVEEFSNWEARG